MVLVVSEESGRISLAVDGHMEIAARPGGAAAPARRAVRAGRGAAAPGRRVAGPRPGSGSASEGGPARHWELKLLALGFVRGALGLRHDLREGRDDRGRAPVELDGLPAGLDVKGRAARQRGRAAPRPARHDPGAASADQVRARLNLVGAGPGEVVLLELEPEHVRVPPGVTVLRVMPPPRVVCRGIRTRLKRPLEAPAMSRLFGTDGIRGARQRRSRSPPSWPSASAASSSPRCSSTTALHQGAPRGRPRHAAVRAAAGGRARVGRAVRGRRRLRGRRAADAGHRVSDAAARGAGRRRALGLAQPLRGQRHQDLLGRGREVPRRLGGRDRGAPPRARRRALADGRATSAGSARRRRRRPTTLAHLRAACRRFDLARHARSSLDCAHGATYRGGAAAVPRRSARGSRVLGARPDGLNINRGVGALHPEALQRKACAPRARTSASPSTATATASSRWTSSGEVRDGDYVLAICGRHLAAQGRLQGGVVVTTVMANLGLDQVAARPGRPRGQDPGRRPLRPRGDAPHRRQPGRRAVGAPPLPRPRHHRRRHPLRAQLLAVMRETGQPLSALAACLTQVPPGARQRARAREAARSTRSPASPSGAAQLEAELDDARPHPAPLLRHRVRSRA